VLLVKKIPQVGGNIKIQIDKRELPSGILVLTVSSATQYVSRKIAISE